VPDPTSVVVVGYRRAVPRTARTVGNTITAALGFLASQAATPVSTKRGQTHETLAFLCLNKDDIRGSQNFVSEMHGDMTDIVDQQ
jgi:hypothetical protein